jgi:hypothetical protein
MRRLLLILLPVVFACVRGEPLNRIDALPIDGLTRQDLVDTFAERRGDGRHDAIDLMYPRGTPVRAMVAGTIRRLFLSKPGGLTIYLFDRDEKFCYYYAHGIRT